MSAITKSDVQRFTVSTIGALILSAACIASAISPAKAAEPNAPLTVGDWQSQVERQIDAKMQSPQYIGSQDQRGVASVVVHFDANGSFTTANLGRTSGSPSIDAAALRTADRIRYPVLPASMRGKPQAVEMELYYGVAGDSADAADQKQRFETVARSGRRHENTQTAA